MTDDEREAAHAELQAVQRRVYDAVHEVVNILTVFKGEVDLAVEHARQLLNELYGRFPEIKP